MKISSSPTADRHDRQPDMSAKEGELRVNKMRVFLSGAMSLFVLAMWLGNPDISRSFFAFTVSTTVVLFLLSCGFILLDKLGVYAGWFSVVSVLADVAAATVLVYSTTLGEPFRFAGSAAPAIYFIAISLAAVRQQPSLAALAGFGSAATYLLISGHFFLTNMAKGSSYMILEGRTMLGLNYLDDVAKALTMVITGWIIAHVARNLKNSERHYQDLFENTPDGVMITDEAGKIETVNGRFAAMVRMRPEDISGRRPEEFLSLKTSMSRPGVLPADLVGDSLSLVAADGTALPVMTSAIAMRTANSEKTVTSVRDVTDQVRMERQIAHLHEMQSVGELAGGMAHDLNNILGGILGATELSGRTARRLPEPLRASLERQLGIIDDCGQRGRDVIRALLSYSRQSEIAGHTVDLSALLDKLVTICAKTFGAEYTVSKEDRVEGAMVEGDEDALVQALLNICINARDAMPDGGEIALLLEQINASRSVLARKPEALPGQMYYSVEIADDGHGIPSALFEKVFDPFFSTKPSGEGTGLGLTMAFNTVRSHGGFIDLSSSSGQGTIFRVNIPVPRRSPGAPTNGEEEADA